MVAVVLVYGTAFMLRRPPQCFVTDDSSCYMRYAAALGNPSSFMHPHGWDDELCYFSRTPLFPLLLAVGRRIAGGFCSGAVLMHFMLGIGVLGALFTASRGGWSAAFTCGVWTALLFALNCTADGNSYPYHIMTEWSAIHTVELFWLTIVISADWPVARRLALLAAMVSCIVLVRPNLFLPFAAAFAIVACRNPAWMRSPRAVSAVLAGFLPIALWFGLNVVRFDRFTLSPYAGINLYGIAGQLGAVAAEPGDSKQFTELAKLLGVKRLENLDGLRPVNGSVTALNIAYTTAEGRIGFAAAQQLGIPPVAFNDLILEYSRRVLNKERPAYARYVLNQLMIARAQLLLTAVLLLTALALARAGAAGAAVEAGAALALTHGACIFSYALVAIELQRYIDVTGLPALSYLAFAAVTLVRTRSLRPAS